eukprot:1160406-Pelagomonas_calceolata.AAC.4
MTSPACSSSLLLHATSAMLGKHCWPDQGEQQSSANKQLAALMCQPRYNRIQCKWPQDSATSPGFFSGLHKRGFSSRNVSICVAASECRPQATEQNREVW